MKQESIFEELYELNEDLSALQEGFEDRGAELRAVLRTISERIAGDQAIDTAARKELEERLQSSSRSEILKRLDRAELERITSQSYIPTEAEKATFEELLQDHQDCLAELIKTRAAVVETAKTVKEKAEAIRSAAAHIDADILKRQNAGFKEEFDRLSGNPHVTYHATGY